MYRTDAWVGYSFSDLPSRELHVSELPDFMICRALSSPSNCVNGVEVGVGGQAQAVGWCRWACSSGSAKIPIRTGTDTCSRLCPSLQIDPEGRSGLGVRVVRFRGTDARVSSPRVTHSQPRSLPCPCTLLHSVSHCIMHSSQDTLTFSIILTRLHFSTVIVCPIHPHVAAVRSLWQPNSCLSDVTQSPTRRTNASAYTTRVMFLV